MPSIVSPQEYRQLAGADLGYSDWVTIDQARIDAFAEVTGDHQFIHVDPVAAAATPFGSTIAHGFLTLSLVAPLFYELAVSPDNMVMGLNYGMNKLRFLAPVRVGSRVRLSAVVAEVSERPPVSFLVAHDIRMEIQDSPKPALVGQFLVLVVTAG
jgi:acyl dehydratase